MSHVKESSKRKREVSDKEKEKHAMNRQVKKAEEDAIKGQMQQLKVEKAHQAEARLKYLLSQSDIFSHFGATQGLSANNDVGKDIKTVGSKHRTVAGEELDDDERAMAKEIGDDDNDGVVESPTTVLLRQPACIVGGAMR